ncbi:hypothetical protein T4D_1450 [Trichinella pseudospiralis]|uniref:Uncharacterized protein n=1 Tax=Trichinella pseudospiralis TaxID=6337 RepID=A0A0V1F7T0_TRIPS|nr:hypothetical protein T4D_1450 [Trichinella pseudospiralis]
MIKHRYGDRYLHNEALEIGFRRLDLSEDLLLIGICIPMCALLILLLNMREQFEEQESKAVPGWLHFSNGNILDIVVKYSLKL